MNQHVAPVDAGMSAAQRADIATLLAQNLLPRNIQWLAERVLRGAEAIADLIGNKPPVGELAGALVERMHQKGLLGEAVAIIRTETRNADLLQGINHILAGNPLAGLAGLQANVHAPEDPFFNSEFVYTHYPRVQRTVCAVGLGANVNRLKGTGFLIAPALVLTNFHVVSDFLDVRSVNGKDQINPKVSGSELFFFFDYLSAPRPLVPPDKMRPHASTMVRAVPEKWLARARCRLANEGVPPYATQAEDKYDYAVIKLEKEIGNVPSRRSGGALRGWLALDSGVDYLGNIGSRLVVLQHPEGAEQLWDPGTYDRLDPSSTRIWYSVNTERGASGAPAFDRQGRLYALHNASVLNEQGDPLELVPGLRVNQGVRIDRILGDLKQDPNIKLPAWVDQAVAYWSLTENVKEDPQPIIGREFFRSRVTAMKEPNSSDRILAVTGPKDSGRHFSVALLKRILGAGVPVIRFVPDDLEKLSPRAFVKAIADELVLPNTSSIPRMEQTESIARWITHYLPGWLAQQFAADQAKNPSRYPVWIVIDAVVAEGTRLSWADDLPELVSALMGPPDSSTQPTPELPQLRWLLLGAPNTIFPPTRMSVIPDDLTAAVNSDYANDFANCMAVAWLATEREQVIQEKFLPRMGAKYTKKAILEKEPIRAYLAAWVRDMIMGDE